MSTLESFQASDSARPTSGPSTMSGPITTGIRAGTATSRPLWREIQAEFGAPTSLEDFERKAQMLNYVDHRAIFEGMNANLWTPNSGRLLWMTQPAWPSTMWQILSSDYDTQASFYGVKKACEPLHVQLDLATDAVQVVNTTPQAAGTVRVTADVFSLDNKSASASAGCRRVPSGRCDDYRVPSRPGSPAARTAWCWSACS